MSSNLNCHFAAYLATLDTTLTILSPLTSINTSPIEHLPHHHSFHDLSSSPLKRPRSDSPDTHISSSTDLSSSVSSVTDHLTFYTSSTSLSAASTSCTLRSILTSTVSSPLSSPPISRPLSRRSSTGASCKSVRFARCTNASVFPALSAEIYDRTPIVPSTESESLELPRRKAETEGWIRCLQKRRADEKTKGCAPWTPADSPDLSTPLASERTVEGIHGMVAGGYFVGEERAERMQIEMEEERRNNGNGDEEDREDDNDDDMMVDDQEEMDDQEDNDIEIEERIEVTTVAVPPVPQLVADDSSTSEEDSDGFTTSSNAELSSPASSVIHELVITPTQSTVKLGFSMERSIPAEEDDDDESEDEETKLRRELEEERREERERNKKSKARYGLCALGKYSRAEVFQSHDSLGGF